MAAPQDGSLAGHASLDALLAAHLPPDALREARRVLYGLNGGEPVQPLQLPAALVARAAQEGYDLQGHKFRAAPEQLRPPRLTRLALIQNGIVAPTDAPYAEQRAAIHARVSALLDAAGEAGATLVCLQEAWHMPFAFCTREKAWCAFAEPVAGPDAVSTQLVQAAAARHGFVVVSPILERDEAHSDTVWNTAVVVSHTGEVLGKHRKKCVARACPVRDSR